MAHRSKRVSFSTGEVNMNYQPESELSEKILVNKLLVSLQERIYQLIKYNILISLLNFENPPTKRSFIQKTKKIIKKGLSICFSAEKDGSHFSQIDLADTLRELKKDIQENEIELRKMNECLFMKLSENEHTKLHKETFKNSDNYLIVATLPNTVLSQKDINDSFDYLYTFFENPSLKGHTISGWKRIQLDKEMIKILDDLIECNQQFRKENQGLVMNVVRSDMFEHALHTSNVETKTLGYTLLFTKEDKIPLVLPIYDKGYISEKDSENSKYSQISHKRV